MATKSDLREARKSLARGRTDEALVYLWNTLEPARLERGATLRELQRLSTLIRNQGEEAQQREAERLLEAISRSSEEGQQIEATVLTEGLTGVPEAAEPARSGTGESGESVATRPRLGRLLLPLVFLLIILINVIARIVDLR
jgi:hypothetical protein